MAMKRLENLDELRVGLYVKLDCSWWSHPFASSRFKIASEQDIETIRKIRKLKLYYDPSLSDPLQSETIQVEETFTEEPEPENYFEFQEEEIDASDPEPDPEPQNEFSVLLDIPDPEEIKKDRKRVYHDRRDHLKKVEDAYWKVLGKSKDIFKRVSTGHREGLKGASEMVTNMTAVLNHDRATMTLMDVVSSTGMTEGLSSHAVNVCILATVVGRELGLSPEELHVLGMGALFHDMGKRLLPMKVNFRASGITMEADQASTRLHPEKGKELMEGYPSFPKESLRIILEHHERMNGGGYPKGLKGNQISRMAQIVMVVDEYDEYCNAGIPEKSLTPHESLSQLYKFTKTQNGKFPEDIILALIRTLSVFPPGSLVELTDGSLGIVTSINIKSPTKPLVLISHFEGTRQEALAVDLALEKNISIRRSLKPREVPPKVLEFLSPRRTAVFLQAEKENSPLANQKP
jgi:HD-GYP domain-containing protein (c-di-GMP phosphodiesterase class II)